MAVAALRDVYFVPGPLNGMFAFGVEAFYGGDFHSGDAGRWRDARSHGSAVNEYRARSALSDAAGVFRAGHIQLVAESPQQGHVRGDVDGALRTVDF